MKRSFQDMVAGQKNMIGIQEPGEAHYFKKQKDCHIIEIKSAKTIEQSVTVHSLEPNFGGLNKTLNQTDEAYYQLKSLAYRNSFKNIKETDQFSLFVDVDIMDLFQLIEAPNAPNQIPPIAPINVFGTTNLEPFQVSGMKSAEELVDILNNRIDLMMYDTIHEHMVNQAAPAPFQISALTPAQQAFIILFDSYKYELLEGKIQLRQRNKELFPNVLQSHQAAAGLIQRNALVIYRFIVNLRVHNDVSEKDKKRLHRIFGMTFPFPGRPGVIRSVSPISRIKQYYNDLFKRASNIDPYEINLVLPDLIVGMTPVGPPIARQPASVTDSTHVITTPYDYIYIRSSLQNNNYDQEGRKKDVIAKVPIDTSKYYGSLVTFEPLPTAGREYNTKVSLGDLKNFTISLTNEDGDPIEFFDGSQYYLELAIFFQPKQAIEYMV